MSTLIDSLIGMATPQIVGALSSRLGESESAVQKGLQGGFASILGALASKAGDGDFLKTIFGLISDSGGGSNLLSSLGSLASGSASSSVIDVGSKFLSQVLGTQQSGIASAIGAASGLKSSSASSLLSMAAPMVLGLLGQKVSDGSLSASSLGSMLKAEAPSLKSFLPAGVSGLLGSLPSASGAAAVADEAASGMKWLVPALLGLALLGGLFWFLNQSKDTVKEVAKTAETTAVTATNTVGDAAKSMWAALGEFFKRKLPNGIELNIPKMGVENMLLDFIENAAMPVDKTTWFDFDRLLFDTGKATLQPASQAQLEDIANIFKAYPNVKAKVGGYTDNVGDKAMNQKLSEERAKNVAAELVKLGVGATRLSAEGYGEEHPVADNATDEGKQKNRRISMRITEK